ncbi:CHAT domain-containing protein [Streptomyces sp. NPDC004262]
MSDPFEDEARAGQLNSVRSRLEHAMRTGDPTWIAGPEAAAEGGRLAAVLAEDPGNHQVRHALGWLHYMRYLAIPERDEEELAAAVDAFVSLLLVGCDVEVLPEPIRTDLVDLASLQSRNLAHQALSSADPALLEVAVLAARSVIQATPANDPQRADRLITLANALHMRYSRFGESADLDAAVKFAHAAVADPGQADPLDRAISLNGLGVLLCARSADTGGNDLDEAIASFRAAANGVPHSQPFRARFLFNLGGALRTRYEEAGNIDDLHQAIDVLQTAVDAAATDDPDRAIGLNNLGNALRSRFDRLGDRQDIDLAVVASRVAVSETPTDHPQRAARLATLAVSLETRYKRAGNSEDLDEAVTVGREAVDLTSPGHVDRGRRLNNMAGALHVRYLSTGSNSDLDEAISAYETAVAVTPAEAGGRRAYLGNLGAALRLRYRRENASADLDEAITALEAALLATPAEHAERVNGLLNLGNALLDRHKATSADGDLSAAAAALAEASQLAAAPPSRRIRAAASAARLLVTSAPARAADLLETAVRLLPEVAPRRLTRGDQQYALAEFTGLASEAAVCALRAPGGTPQDRAARSLRLLEAGRAVLISQALEVRSDLTQLRQQHPELAATFVKLRGQLDQQTDTSLPGGSEEGSRIPEAWREAGTRDRDRLARAFADTVRDIRAIEGFASFGLPPTTAELLAEAGEGSLAAFAVSDQGSTALLLTNDGITAVDLPLLGAQALQEKVVAFHRALRSAMRDEDRTRRRQAQAVLIATLEWLWDAAAGPVLDRLGHHRTVSDDAVWPRVWWVPSGPLTLLPLHAAGYHTDPPEARRRTVIDRVISSYTPTIRALRHARWQTAQRPAEARALIVAMPTTPGLPRAGRLGFVEAEVAAVRHHLPDNVLLSEPHILADNNPASTGAAPADGTMAEQADNCSTPPLPTKGRVLQELARCSIAHFSCHGAADVTDPSHSLLLLHDHADDPLTVASLAPVNLNHARLAYLSACRTATVDTVELLDEAIHLTTAFQLAGFPAVIGTLWEIDDQASVFVAKDFYSRLRVSPGTLDTRRAAHALHAATRAMRDALPLTPSLWAAYIHAGA